MKKLSIIFLSAVSLLALVFTTPVYANINDPYIDISIVKNGNVIEINHTSGRDISYAVVEYGYYENNQLYSQLTQIPVINDKFNIQSNWVAIKVHQVKVLQNRIYYTYSTRNENQIGNFNNVQRVGVVEIETVAVKTITTDTLTKASIDSPYYKYYEFYFRFDNEHDRIDKIDVEFVMIEYSNILWWQWESGRENIEKSLSSGETVTYNGYRRQDIGTTPFFFDFPVIVNLLGQNSDTSIDANYVARVAPKNSDLNSLLAKNFSIENFAIIRIHYELDGEFIISDVINDPTTPEDDQINWLLGFIEDIQKGMADFQNWLGTTTDWLLNNANTIVVIVVLLLVGLAWIILSPIFKIAWLLIKTSFRGLFKIFDLLFGWLF